MLKAAVESFKLKLAAYFSLISLLPLAAAFWGFDAVTERAETNRADSVLQVGLRSALATYGDELQRLERSAEAVARDRAFQRALAERDARAVRRALRRLAQPEGGGARGSGSARSRLVRSRPSAGSRWPAARGRLGRVIASLPVDRRLTRRLETHSGLDGDHRLVFVIGGPRRRG